MLQNEFTSLSKPPYFPLPLFSLLSFIGVYIYHPFVRLFVRFPFTIDAAIKMKTMVAAAVGAENLPNRGINNCLLNGRGGGGGGISPPAKAQQTDDATMEWGFGKFLFIVQFPKHLRVFLLSRKWEKVNRRGSSNLC